MAQASGLQDHLSSELGACLTVAVTVLSLLITTRMRHLRKCLREWQASMRNLKSTIANVRLIILFLELLEKYLLDLLEKQRLY